MSDDFVATERAGVLGIFRHIPDTVDRVFTLPVKCIMPFHLVWSSHHQRAACYTALGSGKSSSL